MKELVNLFSPQASNFRQVGVIRVQAFGKVKFRIGSSSIPALDVQACQQQMRIRVFTCGQRPGEGFDGAIILFVCVHEASLQEVESPIHGY